MKEEVRMTIDEVRMTKYELRASTRVPLLRSDLFENGDCFVVQITIGTPRNDEVRLKNLEVRVGDQELFFELK